MRPAILAWLVLASAALCSAQERPASELVTEGLAQLTARNATEAASAFQAVLGMPEESVTPWERAEAHRGLGQVLNLQGRYADARVELDQALKLHQTTGDRTALGQTYTALGYNAWGLGYRDQAREHYETALLEYEAAGALREKAVGLYNLAFMARTREEQLRLLPRALQAARELGDRRLEGKNLHVWSDWLYTEGQYRQSFDLLVQALGMFEEDAASRPELARALTSLGRLYRTHDHGDHAIELYRQALAVQEALGDTQGVVQSLRSIAVTHLDSGEVGKAKALYARALEVAAATGSEGVRSTVLVGLGQAYQASGEHDQALAYLEQAYRTFGEKQNGLLNVLLGSCYLAMGRPLDAEKAAAEAIRLAPRYGNVEALMGGHYVRARALEALGRSEDAVAHLREALAVYEKIRANVLPADFLNRGYSAKSADLFHYGVELLHRAGYVAEMLTVAEQARARSLMDLLATRELQRRAASLPHPPAGSRRATTQPAALSHAGSDSAADDVPDLRTLASAPGVTLEEYRQAARDMGSTIVSYWAARRALYIWTIPAEGDIQVARVDVTRKRLGELIARAGAWYRPTTPLSGGADPAGRQAASSGSQVVAPETSRAAWRELYELLIAPIRHRLPRANGSAVTVVPHGPLFRVPFAGLLDGSGRYLVERYTLNTLPSVALLRFSERWQAPGRETGGDYLLVTDPRNTPAGPTGRGLPALPGARRETAAIAGVLGEDRVRLLEGESATETAVKAAVPRAKIVHLATHGVLLDDRPFDSFLLLGASANAAGDDGRLTAREIYDLRLRADLVVLSACSTALGEVTGDGIVGLTRAFFYAGAPSIVATLWDVADEPTQQVISEFYRAYGEGATRSAALRAAQLRLLERLRAGRVSVRTPLGDVTLPEDPRLWAGVALIGEP